MSRLEKYRDASAKSPDALSPEEAAERRRFEELMRRQRVEQSFERGAIGTETDPRAVFQRDRGRIPPEYREQYEAFVKSLQQGRASKSK
jgi:hypothetical protein